MAWKLEGTYFENCSCDWICPCTYSSLTAPATYDRCHAVLIYNVRSGEIDGQDVSGLTVAVVADTPQQMTDGNWRLGLLIDDKASPQQRDALAGVFSGQKGGPMAGLAPLVGEVLGVESARIEYRDEGRRHSAKVGDGIEIAVEDFVPATQPDAEPTKLVNVFHPTGSTLTLAKPTASRIEAFGMTFENEGRSSFSAPFSWSA